MYMMVELFSQYISAVLRKEQISAVVRKAKLQLLICGLGIAEQNFEMTSISDGGSAKER